jgi:hypothetical protein
VTTRTKKHLSDYLDDAIAAKHAGESAKGDPKAELRVARKMLGALRGVIRTIYERNTAGPAESAKLKKKLAQIR